MPCQAIHKSQNTALYLTSGKLPCHTLSCTVIFGIQQQTVQEKVGAKIKIKRYYGPVGQNIQLYYTAYF